jgi:hypothetical protein
MAIMTADWKAKPVGDNGCQLSLKLKRGDIRSRIIPMSIPELNAAITAYKNGAYIQHAFAALTLDEREFLMTGMSKEEWDEVFPDA